MLLLVVRFHKYHEVIDVDYAHIQHIMEDLVHHLLECDGRVTEIEVHNKRLEGPFVRGECSLPHQQPYKISEGLKKSNHLEKTGTSRVNLMF